MKPCQADKTFRHIGKRDGADYILKMYRFIVFMEVAKHFHVEGDFQQWNFMVVGILDGGHGDVS